MTVSVRNRASAGIVITQFSRNIPCPVKKKQFSPSKSDAFSFVFIYRLKDYLTKDMLKYWLKPIRR